MSTFGTGTGRPETPRPPARAARRALWVAVPVLLLLLAWPIQLGGQFGWLTTTGNSMAPLLDEGALVLLRRTGSPQVGDVIAYHSPEIDRTVLHRVIEVSGAELVTQGDNNDFVDGYRPTRADVLGEMIFHVPLVGRFLAGFTTPLGLASIAVFVVAGMYLLRARRRTGPAPDGLAPDDPSPRPEPGPTGAPAPAAPVPSTVPDAVRTALAVGAAVLAVVGVISFLRPTSETEVRAFPYNLTGRFEYRAAAGEPSVVYPDGAAHTGDPVFLALASTVHFTFELRSDASPRAEVSGSATLSARVSDQDGWQHTIELATLPAFSGPTATLEGDLDLAELRRRLDEVQALTLVNRPQHQVAIVADVAVRTRFEATEDDQVFAPTLAFRLDPKQLTLLATAPDGSTASLTPAQGATIETSVTRPTYFTLLGLRLPVTTVRVLAVAGLAAIGLAYALLRSAPRRFAPAGAAPPPGGPDGAEVPAPVDEVPAPVDEAARIARQYGPLLLALPPQNFYVDEGLTPVATIAELAAIAMRSGALIMCTQVGGAHVYQVNAGGTLYRYTLHTAESSSDAGPEDADPKPAAKRTAKKRAAKPAAGRKTTDANAEAKTGVKKRAAKRSAPGERTAPARKAAGPQSPTRAERSTPPLDDSAVDTPTLDDPADTTSAPAEDDES